ncbi:unnamed protein product [Orchesella dallaii]|uniref:Myb-like domain-containing protein n=1 Tax=Orchesella dallaii TaxID=48710 RepID=A0ABP1QSU5_9HEXA
MDMDSFNIQNYFKRGKTVVLTLRQGDDDGARQWSDKDTSELLKLMKDFLPEFQNQRRRKKEVWVDVSKQLQSIGYTWTPEDCRKKWSNMIRTFKGIEEQKQDPTSSFKRVKWPFYDVMLELLSLDGSDSFPEATVVCQILNSSNNGNSLTNGSSKLYKSRPLLPPPRQHLHHVVEGVGAHVTQRHQTSLTLGTEADLTGLSVAVHDHNPGPSIVDSNEVPSTSHSDLDPNNMLFTESPAFKKATGLSPPISIHRHSLAVRSKKRALLKKKSGRSERSAGEVTTETSLEKFIEATNKQNEQMLDKITCFHQNALELMQERNILLREIRDSLHEDINHSANLDSCHQVHHHHEMGHQEDHTGETLTLHMGPPYSTSGEDSQNNVGSQLNSTLMISADPATASALSTFQLADGTVLSEIDTSQDKGVLTNLGSYADSVMPEVSLLPTLVSVVDTGGNTTNMTLSIPTTRGKRSLGKGK